MPGPQFLSTLKVEGPRLPQKRAVLHFVVQVCFILKVKITPSSLIRRKYICIYFHIGIEFIYNVCYFQMSSKVN